MFGNYFYTRLPDTIRLITRTPGLCSIQLFGAITSSRVEPVDTTLIITVFGGVSYHVHASYTGVGNRRTVHIYLFTPLRGFVYTGYI